MAERKKQSPYDHLPYLLNKDKKQVRFDDNGWLVKPQSQPIIERAVINPNEEVMCPFCLFQAKLSRFFISNKKGISESNAMCPECKNGMRMRTLLADMSADDYATFVFAYRRMGFWQKCPFDSWRKRLKSIGWATPFWEKYKELKAGETSDSVFDDAEKMAKDYGIDVHER